MIKNIPSPMRIPLPQNVDRRKEAMTQGFLDAGTPAENQLEALKKRAGKLTNKIKVPTFDEAGQLPDEMG